MQIIGGVALNGMLPEKFVEVRFRLTQPDMSRGSTVGSFRFESQYWCVWLWKV